MKTYTEMLPHIEGNDYETHFWNAIRGKQGHKAHLAKGIDTTTGMSAPPMGMIKVIPASRSGFTTVSTVSPSRRQRASTVKSNTLSS